MNMIEYTRRFAIRALTDRSPTVVVALHQQESIIGLAELLDLTFGF